MSKKIISLFLIITMLMALGMPGQLIAMAEDSVENEVPFTVTAKAETPMTIVKSDYHGTDYDGILSLTGGTFNAERDYAQSCTIQVKNLSETTIEYYLSAENPYDDIYLNFVRSGSIDSPIAILPGETQDIQLDIFLQNAVGVEYVLPVYANILGEYEQVEAKTTVVLNCPKTSVEFELKETAENKNSLAKTFSLKNIGVDLTDVNVYADSVLENYISFSPIISNYSMKKGESTSFRVRPDLNKMKANNIEKLEGEIVVASGASTQRFAVSFDTKGQEIVSTTMGELAAMQAAQSNGTLTTNASGKAAIQYQYSGSQCTNAGQTNSDFYLDDFDIISTHSLATEALDKSEIELYITNRMYGGEGVNRWYGSTDPNYVDIEETTYTYYVNGAPAGTSHSSGVTDVAMVKLPTDNLKFGQNNKIVCDYDTNPGHYFVSSDVQLTILVPGNTPVSYIGSPKGLDDVRSLPDFTIYPENIYPAADVLFVGEQTSLKMNIYNRGSEEGDFDISVTDGTNEIYQEKDHHLDAFSGDVLSFDWTPQNESNTITVTLTNTDTSVMERDTKNNVATKEIAVRHHSVPTIRVFDDVSSVYNNSTILTAELADWQDVSDVQFYVDNQLVTNGVNAAVLNGNKQYHVKLDGKNTVGQHETKVVATYTAEDQSSKTVEKTATLTVLDKTWAVPSIGQITPERVMFGTYHSIYARVSNTSDVIQTQYFVDDKEANNTYGLGAGEHTVKVVVTYWKNSSETATIEKTQSLIVVDEKSSFIKIDLNGEFTNPSFRIYNYYDGFIHYNYNSVYPSKDGTAYNVPVSLEMYDTPENYIIYVFADEGVLIVPLSGGDVSIRKADCRTAAIEHKEGLEISDVQLQRADGKSIYSSLRVADTSKIYLTPASYTFHIGYSYKGIISYSNVDIDVTEKDANIDVTQQFKSFKVKFLTKPEFVSATMYIQTTEGNERVYGGAVGVEYNAEKSTAELTLMDSNTVEIYSAAQNAFFVLTTEDAAYKFEVKKSGKEVAKNITTLCKTSLRKLVVYVSKRDTITISHIYAYSQSIGSVSFAKSVIYLPAGEYGLNVQCTDGKQSFYAAEKINLKTCKILRVNIDRVDLTVKWNEAFDLNRSELNGNGEHYFYQNAISGDTFSVQKDQYMAQLLLYRNSATYRFETELDASQTDIEWIVDSSFSGKIDNEFSGTYSGNDSVYLSLSDLMDSHETRLIDFYASSSADNWKGNVIFTNSEDENDVIKVPVETSAEDGVYVSLPNVAGTYTVTVELTTEGAARQTQIEDPCVNGHEWGEWQYNDDASFFRDGTCSRTCNRCGEKETQRAAATAKWHSFVADGTHSWIVIAIVTVAAVVARIVLHYVFWYVPWL